MARQLVEKYLDDSIAGGGSDTWTSVTIPNGETWHVTRFGAAARLTAAVALQVRTATSPDVWGTIRAIMGPGAGEYHVDRDLVGDGVARVRIVRQEKSGGAQPIIAWLEGYKMP